MTYVLALAAGTTATTSADITVTAAAPVNTVFIFATDGVISSGMQCPVQRKVFTTGLYQQLTNVDGRKVILTDQSPEYTFQSPGIYRVVRSVVNEAIGVGVES